MQFVCDRCKAKYDIDESRLRGKAVKIRCRGCGNVLEVRDPNLPPGSQPSLPPPPAPPPRARGRIATPLGKPAVAAVAPPRSPGRPGPLGEKFQKAFEGAGVTPGPGTLPAHLPSAAPAPVPRSSGGPPAAESADEATHIIATPFLAEAAKQVAKEEISRKLARWHVAIRNQPMGPMSEEAIRRHVDNDEVGLNTLVWREGFDEWRQLGQVRDLAYLAEIITKKGGPTAQPTWRESVFDLPPLARAAVTTAGGAPSLVPPPPGWNRWLIHGLVAVIAFALGMVFMYLVSGGDARPAATSAPAAGGGLPVAEEVAVEANLPTIRSGSLTIQLTNPTVVGEETINPPAADGGTAEPVSAGGSTGPRTGPRTSGGVSSRGADGGTAPTAGSLPSRDLGPAGGQIRTGGTSGIAVGGGTARPLTAQQILPVVSGGQGGIQHCYDQARVRDFIADLSLRLTIEIAPEGNVRNTSLSSEDYITGDLESCILNRVRTWSFPRASASSRVVLPFAFHQR
jgi:predicted Zn finger-like uncharacterized protein